MFTWDITKAIANFEKHGIPFEEASTIFVDANALTKTILNTPRRNLFVSA